MTTYLSRIPRYWIEGQLITPKAYGNTVYASLRDTESEIAIQLVIPTKFMDDNPALMESGVLVKANIDFEWRGKRGEAKGRVHAIQAVGAGDLMLQIENRRKQLAAEGLFDSDRKRALPFLPRKIGLITGRDTAAQSDFRRITANRWPARVIEVREIALMQKDTPLLAIRALAELEAIADVDVIVIARGGGSFEELLPWSDEGLVRAVVASVKPVVSAIGHEPDHPILDDAADVRASTPTDAANRVVPDLQEELAFTGRLASRLRDHYSNWLRRELQHLTLARTALRAGSPKGQIQLHRERVTADKSEMRNAVTQRINQEMNWLHKRQAGLKALSPFAVLSRGYALATKADGSVIRKPLDIEVGGEFKLQLSEGIMQAARITEKE